MKRKSLAEEKPELLSHWDRGNTLSPFEVSSGSHKKVWWVCDKGHTWEATVKNRALIGSSCPYCEHRAVLKGYNDLQTVNPKLAREWSPKNKLKPSDVSPSSNTEVLWICKNGHEWSARVADRSEGHGCPYCAGHRVWKGFNDLATTHPELVSEWSVKNKGLSPETITYKNRTNVWWQCSKCGNEYQAVVYARAKGRICPFCIAGEIKRLRNKRLAEFKICKDFE
jgi:DNA-directed RNA polymerase subunit RPC12/RpoP